MADVQSTRKNPVDLHQLLERVSKTNPLKQTNLEMDDDEPGHILLQDDDDNADDLNDASASKMKWSTFTIMFLLTGALYV